MPAKILNAEKVAADLSASLKSLAKLTGFSERTVTLAECGVILKTCVGRTKVAKPENIKIRAKGRVLKHLGLTSGALTVTINSGARGPSGRVWSVVGPQAKGVNNRHSFLLAGQMSDDAQNFSPTKFHFRPALWMDIKETTFDYGVALRKALPNALASAALARQSWVQIADDLGIILEDIPGGNVSAAAITKARRAIASNGQTYQNGIGTIRFEENKSFVATLTNQLPYWPKIELDSILLSVVAGRTEYFKQNCQRGVLASYAETIRAYPWIKLVGGG